MSLHKNSTYNPAEALAKGIPLRVSKSSFIGYDGCPRRYWWEKVAGLRGPPTEHMVHGTQAHETLENLYNSVMEAKEVPDIEGIRPLMTGYDHEAVDNLASIEGERLRRWGPEHFIPVEAEVKHEVKHPLYNAVRVGAIDGVLRHPDGGLIVAELKTGKVSKFKHNKTRRELCYYRFMLELLGYGSAIYFYYMYPECDNMSLYQELESKRNNEVWLGDFGGMAVLEKVNKRSVTAMHKKLNVTIEGLFAQEWPMKWNDYFCSNYCDYHMACESEQLGLDPDPTQSYTGDTEGWA